MDSVGARLRELRRQRRLTQEQLAEKAGVSRSYVADLESGQIKRPDTPDNLKLLAAALEVSLPELAEPLGWYDGVPVDDPSHWVIGMRGDPSLDADGKRILGEMAELMRKRAKPSKT